VIDLIGHARGFGLALVVATGLGLAGCAVVPPMPPAADASSVLSGRMSVRVGASATAAARSVSAGFELQGDADSGSLNLSTPLGTLMAQARWSPGTVTLITPQGQSSWRDLDALTQEVLGESIPVPALFDWLRGRPWPGADSAAGEPGSFSQLGWQVNVAEFSRGAVEATRSAPPAVTVRVRLDH
jgi:outer membrane lipoprotein LolB